MLAALAAHSLLYVSPSWPHTGPAVSHNCCTHHNTQHYSLAHNITVVGISVVTSHWACCVMIAAHITTHSITVQYISLLLCVSPSWLHTVSSVSNDYCTHSTHNYNTWYTFTTQPTHCASVQHNTTITTQCTSIQHNTHHFKTVHIIQYTPSEHSAHLYNTIHIISTHCTSIQHNTHHLNTLHIYTTQYTASQHTDLQQSAQLYNTPHAITTQDKSLQCNTHHYNTAKCTALQHSSH